MLRHLCNLKPGHYFFLSPTSSLPLAFGLSFSFPLSMALFDLARWPSLSSVIPVWIWKDGNSPRQMATRWSPILKMFEWRGKGGMGVGGSFSPRQHHSIWWTSSPRTSHGKPPLGSSVFSISSTPPQPHIHTHTFTPPPQPRVVLGSQCSSSPLDSFCCTSGRPHCPHPDLYLIHAGLMIHGAAYFVLNFVPNKFEI